MHRIIAAIFSLLFSIQAICSDSLKVKAKRFIIAADLSRPFSPFYAIGIRAFRINTINTNWYAGGKLKGAYIIPGTPKNNLAAGFDASFNSFYLSEYRPDRENSAYKNYSIYTYDPNILTVKNTTGTVGIFVSLCGVHKRFYFSHDLGIRFSFFEKNKIIATYKENYYSSAEYYSMDSVTTNNPTGMYHYESRTTKEIKEVYNFYNTVIPFYNVDLGLNFKNVIPHIGFEFMYYKDFIMVESENFLNSFILRGLVFKANVGVACKF